VSTGDRPVEVGLVGAGPWAQMVHAPAYAAGPDTVLRAVWARRPDQAAALAEAHGARPARTLEELWDACDVVVHCVPPGVQAELALEAVERGLPVVLEKPVAADLDGARRLAEAVERRRVASLIVLTWRFSPAVQRFLAEQRTRAPLGARATFTSPALLEGPFRTPWRIDAGPLLDLGPHVLDALDATVGRITGITARGDRRRWVALTVDHEGGATSQALVSGHVPGSPVASLEVFAEEGHAALDVGASLGPATIDAVRAAVVRMVRDGRTDGLDVQRGLEVQRWLEAAGAQLD
jgi:predicted dehydrogenase